MFDITKEILETLKNKYSVDLYNCLEEDDIYSNDIISFLDNVIVINENTKSADNVIKYILKCIDKQDKISEYLETDKPWKLNETVTEEEIKNQDEKIELIDIYRELIDDEEEAIEGYDKAISRINELNVARNSIFEELIKIKKDEMQHIKDLKQLIEDVYLY